jgi:predicted O-methyltransferase YrrM
VRRHRAAGVRAAGARVIDLRDPAWEADARALELFVAGHLLSSVLFSAVELGLFDRLRDGPLDADALARALEVAPSALDRLAVALRALGLLTRDEEGRWRNTPLADAMLTTTGAQSIVPEVRLQQRLVAPLFAHLTEGLRTGAPQLLHWPFVRGAVAGDCYAELSRHPAEHALLMRAMNAASRGVGRVIAESVDLKSARRLVDLGGGGGEIAVELATALPALEVVIVDVPAACRQAAARVREAGLGGRIRCVPADLRAPLPPSLAPADAVLLSGVLSDWPPVDRDVVLGNAVALLGPGGQLLVSETLFQPGRRGPARPALQSLFMMLSTRGDNFSSDELERLLRRVGLEDVRVSWNGARGLRDLVVARKPR